MCQTVYLVFFIFKKMTYSCCSCVFVGLSIGVGAGSGPAFLFLVLATMFLLRKIKERRNKNLRQRFFEQNRRQLRQQGTDIAERMVITLKELEKATNNFDKAR